MSVKIRSMLGAVCMSIVGAVANAAPVDVSYSVTGSAGSWDYDFSVTNNIGGGQDLYFFGVNLPDHNPTNDPSGFNSNVWLTWNNTLSGGTGIYNNNWIDFSFAGLPSGSTVSGFTVHDTSAGSFSSVAWFAFGAGGSGGDLTGCIQCSSFNPGYEGVASISAVPEPETYAMLLAGLGLLGFAARRRKQLAAA